MHLGVEVDADHAVTTPHQRRADPTHPRAGIEDRRAAADQDVGQPGLALDVGAVGDELCEVGAVPAPTLGPLLGTGLLPPGLATCGSP